MRLSVLGFGPLGRDQRKRHLKPPWPEPHLDATFGCDSKGGVYGCAMLPTTSECAALFWMLMRRLQVCLCLMSKLANAASQGTADSKKGSSATHPSPPCEHGLQLRRCRCFTRIDHGEEPIARGEYLDYLVLTKMLPDSKTSFQGQAFLEHTECKRQSGDELHGLFLHMQRQPSGAQQAVQLCQELAEENVGCLTSD